MNRREFGKLLSSGALMAMLLPSVAQAFQAGTVTEDQLFDLLQDGSDSPVLVKQEWTIVARMKQQVDGKVLDPNRPWSAAQLNNMPPPFFDKPYKRPYATAWPQEWDPSYIPPSERFPTNTLHLRKPDVPSNNYMDSGYIILDRTGEKVVLTHEVQGKAEEKPYEVTFPRATFVTLTPTPEQQAARDKAGFGHRPFLHRTEYQSSATETRTKKFVPGVRVKAA